jgi:hypothetical protein
MYALARTLGGCIAVTAATVRNRSSSILRRLGGTSIEVDGYPVQRYYDPWYRCEMELLRFDSSAPEPRYLEQLNAIVSEFGDVATIYPGEAGVGVPSASDSGVFSRVA